MTYNKNQSTILDFPANVPVTITLKTNPSQAKAKDYTSKAGKAYKKWTYFTTNDEVFWAFGDLHKQLQSYQAGDSVIITNIVPMGAQYGELKVSPVAPRPAVASPTAPAVQPKAPTQVLPELGEILKLVKVLNEKFDAHFGTISPVGDEEETDTKDLPF